MRFSIVPTLGLFSALLAIRLSAQPTLLEIDRNAGPARITVNGEPGRDYTLLAVTNGMASTNWEFLATLTLSGETQSWFDSESMLMPWRFYQAAKLDPVEPAAALDFRLLDHQGKTRWLTYYNGMPGLRAIVLIFTGNGCAKVRDMAPTIRSLTNQFGPQGVLFWLIDSNAGDNRSNILAEAISLGLSNGPPILHDAAQLVARAYRATTAPEAVAVNPDPTAWNIFYRGAIDDRLGTNLAATTQYFLKDALSNFLAGQTISPSRTRTAGCALVLNPPPTNVSYSLDIAPLLQTKCVRCHSPGNIAPWAMTDYSAVYSRRGSIKVAVMTGDMPPWHADPLYNSFTNDVSLKPAESAKLIQWIDTGAPRGTGPDPLADSSPPPTNYPYAWPANLGAPTAILRISPQSIPANGTVDYRYITVTNNYFATDVWLRAAVARPGNARVVHHCLVFEGDPVGSLFGLTGFFAGYTPGAEAVAFPAGTGKLLKKGQVFTIQMHYTTVGSNQTDQTELGLYMAPAPPSYPLQTRAAYNTSFSIPASSSTYQATAQHPGSGNLTTNVLIYEMSPHMHLRGSWFKFEAIYPNGSRETLLSVPNYVFHWQSLYRLTTPKYVPKGSKLVCTGGWDNTHQNPHLHHAYESSLNPSYLPESGPVGFGEQSWNEMFIGYFNYAEVP